VVIFNFFTNIIKSVFGPREGEYVVCFEIANYEELVAIDCDIITKLERNLCASGALPAEINVRENSCCATMVDPTVKPNDILVMLKNMGFQAHLKNEELAFL